MIDHCSQNCEFSTLLQLPFLVLGEVGGMVTKMNTVYLEWFCRLKVMALFQQSVSSRAQMSCIHDVHSKFVFSFSVPSLHALFVTFTGVLLVWDEDLL